MPWYRRLAWSFYPRILVLGMGRFRAAVAFLAWVVLSLKKWPYYVVLSKKSRGHGMQRVPRARPRRAARADRSPSRRSDPDIDRSPSRHPSRLTPTTRMMLYTSGQTHLAAPRVYSRMNRGPEGVSSLQKLECRMAPPAIMAPPAKP